MSTLAERARAYRAAWAAMPDSEKARRSVGNSKCAVEAVAKLRAAAAGLRESTLARRKAADALFKSTAKLKEKMDLLADLDEVLSRLEASRSVEARVRQVSSVPPSPSSSSLARSSEGSPGCGLGI